VAYKVELRPEAADDLRRLDRPVAQRVLRRLRWLSENFDNLAPEALSAQWKGLYKLRIGSYRALYTADKDNHVITVHLIAHRKDIYKK